ncbi:hypothetical protein F4820DRAFT_445855 [Hypoxylon rubiginosum]|uniref:Uncharacterized protein n=1 Tax=Hypoxylon rubiginosum TaxID=110542 RepID=A0ACB9Z7N2_9PEZI|nr:hypothetical protein F4820DRAFT_445855 [Hypoxylon rubiginosum]
MAGEKTTKKKLADLPAWYLRIRRQIRRDEPYSEDEFSMEDFDEDISELEEEEEDDFKCHCEAQDDPYYGCECGPESEDETNVSEASYDGPDAEHYYKLKDMREERKEDLREIREEEEARKQTDLKSHRCRIEEVQAAYKALEEELKKNDGKGSLINFFDDYGWGADVRSKSYDLFSVDYLENCYQWDYFHYWSRIDFDEYNEPEDRKKPRSKSRRRKTPSAEPKASKTVRCSIYSPEDEPELKPFHAPDRAGLETYPLKTKDGKYEIPIQFIGEEYLKMQAPRNFIKVNKAIPVADSAPEVFEFVGVLRRFKKRKLEEEETWQRKTPRLV